MKMNSLGQVMIGMMMPLVWLALAVQPVGAQADGAAGSPPQGIAGACPGTGNCFEEHDDPGCDTAVCCGAVCQIDSWCCEVEWDDVCVEHAQEICGVCGGAGAADCFTVHDFPACDDPDCCAKVCENDPFCCDNQWDGLCVGAALAKCACGGAQTGNCFQNHPTPYCNNAECCDAVCAVDSFCCDVSWDDWCVSEAQQICSNCGGAGAGSCFSPHTHPSCNDSNCCDGVCIIDPFCCNIQWDDQCVANAMTECASCGGSATGSCFAAHESPWCSSSSCCASVCSIDPFCCQSAWDGICVSEAATLCCAADVAPQPTPNGEVDVDDLLAVIGAWGPCAPGLCSTDIAPEGGDDLTNVDDLLSVIANWGSCP